METHGQREGDALTDVLELIIGGLLWYVNPVNNRALNEQPGMLRLVKEERHCRGLASKRNSTRVRIQRKYLGVGDTGLYCAR